MFDQFQKEPPGRKWIGPKILAFSVMGMLLAAGLCGVGSKLDRQGAGMVFTGIGALICVVCVLAFWVGLPVTIGEAIRELWRKSRRGN